MYMKRVILQIPMSEELKKAAEKSAIDMGFSSLQETIRVLLKKLSTNKLKMDIYDVDEPQLSPRAIKRYNKIAKEIEAGKNIYKPKNSKDMFEWLRS